MSTVVPAAPMPRPEDRFFLAGVERELAERHLRHFIPQAWDAIQSVPFTPNWHIDAICDHVEAVESGDIRNLLVTMPPRMLKSLTLSVFYPSWRWIRKPWISYVYASYSSDLSTVHSVLTRRVIQSEWYQNNWGDRFQLAWDSNLKTRFENDKGGVRFATSVGGVLTGQGGDRFVADDPHNVIEAHSLAARNQVIRWWDEAVSSRLNDPKSGSKIIIMQRVHEDDLAGHVLDKGDYVHLNLPMEHEPANQTWTGFGEPDPRTEPGELLSPDRMGPAEVRALKIALGSRAYAGQYQQRPAPDEGDVFKKRDWRYWHPRGTSPPPVVIQLADGSLIEVPSVELPEGFDQELQSWDMAFKDTKKSDFVCGQVWGALRADRFLLDQVLDRLNFPASVEAVRRLSAKWPRAKLKLVEDKANGPAVIATLEKELTGIVAVNPEGGKESRANAASPEVESHHVYLPHPRYNPWVDGFIEELAVFPSGRHDDQVDAFSQAMLRLQQRPPLLAMPEDDVQSRRETFFPNPEGWHDDDEPWDAGI